MFGLLSERCLSCFRGCFGVGLGFVWVVSGFFLRWLGLFRVGVWVGFWVCVGCVCLVSGEVLGRLCLGSRSCLGRVWVVPGLGSLGRVWVVWVGLGWVVSHVLSCLVLFAMPCHRHNTSPNIDHWGAFDNRIKPTRCLDGVSIPSSSSRGKRWCSCARVFCLIFSRKKDDVPLSFSCDVQQLLALEELVLVRHARVLSPLPRPLVYPLRSSCCGPGTS